MKDLYSEFNKYNWLEASTNDINKINDVIDRLLDDGFDYENISILALHYILNRIKEDD